MSPPWSVVQPFAPFPTPGGVGFPTAIIGQVLFESATFRYSPWFAAEADGAIFACDTIVVSSSDLRFFVVVQTKNRGDTDAAATTAVTFGTISSTGRTTATATGLKELVRYRYGVGSDPETLVEWVHSRMLDPTWLWN